MDRQQLKQRVDAILAVADDDEAAHGAEDQLHLDVIAAFCPEWVQAEIERVNNAAFERWCA